MTGRPVLLYDGDCGFCRRWVNRWMKATAGRIDAAPFQEAAARFPQVDAQRLARQVALVDSDGSVRWGAEAVFRALDIGGRRAPLAAYRSFPPFHAAADTFYAAVAANRAAFSKADFFLTGGKGPDTFVTGTGLFLRSLAAVFAIAFLSLAVQIHGLIGARGILPAAEFLSRAAEHLGPERFRLVPTVLWLGASDAALTAVCAAGAAVSLAAIVLPWAPLFAAAWALYLSLVSAGGAFLSFQWDVLLLECGLIAVFLARWRPLGASQPPAPAVFLCRWLLFRLMLMSGAVKLLSGDPAWNSLRALSFHYETQPLPTVPAWFAHQLPPGFHVLECAAMFAVELGAPFLLFAPRRLRHAGAAALALLQILIFVTGNYCFFNLLTVALCLAAVDDEGWRSAASALRVPRAASEPAAAEALRKPRGFAAWPAAVVIFAVSAFAAGARFGVPAPRPVERLADALEPFRSVNSYGLFAVMTTERPEILIEGSEDGERWVEYRFRWKPQEPDRPPRRVAPHQPRLDWQMWFAALGPARQSPWLFALCGRLLEASAPVLSLFREDPFDGRRPRYVRATLYDYRFSTPGELRRSGVWWVRTKRGQYIPPLALKEGGA